MSLYFCLVPKMANTVVLWVIVYFCVTSVNTKDWCLYNTCTVVSTTLSNSRPSSLTQRLSHSAITTINNPLTHSDTLHYLYYTINTPARSTYGNNGYGKNGKGNNGNMQNMEEMANLFYLNK